LRRKKIEENLRSAASKIRQRPVDLLALQEAESEMIMHKNFHQSEFLAQQAGFSQVAQGEHVITRRMKYGTALLSRLRILESDSHVFPRSPLTFPKGFVSSEIISDCGKRFRVISVHLDFLHEKTRKRQVNILCDYLCNLENLPLIIMGDFNSQFSRNSALKFLADKLNLQLWNPQEKIISFPKLRLRLDWILISQELSFKSYELWSDLASDHLAVRAEIEFLK
jgi:endonuclease/exonuclease/phosphatase family metal-dependent hydrolase